MSHDTHSHPTCVYTPQAVVRTPQACMKVGVMAYTEVWSVSHPRAKHVCSSAPPYTATYNGAHALEWLHCGQSLAYAPVRRRRDARPAPAGSCTVALTSVLAVAATQVPRELVHSPPLTCKVWVYNDRVHHQHTSGGYGRVCTATGWGVELKTLSFQQPQCHVSIFALRLWFP